MDARLKHAIDVSKKRKTFENQLNILKTRSQVHLVHSVSGGKFTIDRALVSFVSYLVNDKNQSNMVLLDDRNLPIMVEDLNMFLEEITSKYMEVTLDYYQEYTNLRKSSEIENIAKIHTIDNTQQEEIPPDDDSKK